MVRTRSGQTATDESNIVSNRVYLRRCDIRPRAEETLHMCPICLENMFFIKDKRPSWSQCPACKEVVHESCIRKYMRQQDTEFACPMCRTIYDMSAFEEEDAWSAEALIEDLIERQDSDYTHDNGSDAQEEVERCLRPRLN